MCWQALIKVVDPHLPVFNTKMFIQGIPANQICRWQKLDATGIAI
jgi:hypothetical protein